MSLEEGLHGLEEEEGHLRVGGLDGALDAGDAGGGGELHEEDDAAGDLGGEVDDVLVAVLPLRHEEHVRRRQPLHRAVDALDDGARQLLRHLVRVRQGLPCLQHHRAPPPSAIRTCPR